MTPRTGFVYDTNKQSLLLTQKLNVTLENPAASNKKIVIEGYSFINAITTFMFADFIHMPTTNLPSTTAAPLPYIIGTSIANPGNTAIFKYSVSSNALGGGTNVLSLPLEPSSRNHIPSAPITLLPGVIIGLCVNSGIVVSGLNVVIYTREEEM